MSRSSKTRNDLVLSFSSQVVYKLIGFAVLALLARHLVKEEFGQLMFALSLTGVAVLLTEFGSSTWLVRAVATEPDAAVERTADVVAVRLMLMGAYLGLVNAFAMVAKPDLVLVVAVTSVYIGLKDLYRSFASLFLGLKRVSFTVLVFGSSLVLQLAAIAAAVALDAGLPAILGCYVLSGISLVGLSVLVVRLRIGAMRLRWKRGLAGQMIRQSLPLFVLTLLALLHFSADTLMLGFLQPYREVARYEAGAKLLEASQFLVRPVTLIFFPICAEIAARRDWPGLRRLMRRLALAAVGLGGIIAVVVIGAAGLIVPIVYGPEFGDAVVILRVLYLSVPALYVTIVGTFVAISMHRERAAMVVMAIGVAANVSANAVVIPRWGALGAAWSTAATQTGIALGLAALAVVTMRRPDHLLTLSFPQPAEPSP